MMNNIYIELWDVIIHVDGLVQCCSISIAYAMEILQSCTKPSVYALFVGWGGGAGMGEECFYGTGIMSGLHLLIYISVDWSVVLL